MMGWMLVGAMALGALVALRLSGYPRGLWSIPLAAVLLGAAGYAWQGSPGLAEHPVAAEAPKGEVDRDLVALREKMFGRFNFDYSYFTAADAMTRAGSPDDAVNVMLGAVRKSPKDAALWTGLGLVLSEHDAMQMSPAAKLSFERAMQLWPKHPGPPFFYGLAYVRGGKLAEAKPLWTKALELTPEKASFRDELLVRLFLLDRVLQIRAAQERGEAPPPIALPPGLRQPPAR